MKSVRIRNRSKDGLPLAERLIRMADDCEEALRNWRQEGAPPRVWGDSVFVGHARVAKIRIREEDVQAGSVRGLMLSVQSEVLIPSLTPGGLREMGDTGTTRPGKVEKAAKEAIKMVREASKLSEQTLRLLVVECTREAARLGLPPDECVLAASEAVVREVMDT